MMSADMMLSGDVGKEAVAIGNKLLQAVVLDVDAFMRPCRTGLIETLMKRWLSSLHFVGASLS